MTESDRSQTDLVRRRYDRVAPIYDAMEWVAEFRFSKWRRDQWDRVEGDEILELGVGTGKNLPYYPEGRDITAIDIAPKMLKRARRRAEKEGVEVALLEADAQDLPFDDNSFDAAVATFVFCSVPDPVQGLKEALRVVRPGGQLILVEHVLSGLPVLHSLMRWFDWLPVHVWGAHIDRQTVKNVERAGFSEVRETPLALDVVKRIEARVPTESGA